MAFTRHASSLGWNCIRKFSRWNIHFEIQAGERAHITQVQVTGAPGFPRETVLRAAKLKPGQELTPQRLQKAVRRLRNYYRKRTYLESRHRRRRGRRYLPEENGLLLVLEVNRGPQVEVNVVGAKLSGSKRRELLPIYTEGSVDADLVREGKNNLQDFYQHRGHFDVEVEAHIREEPNAEEPSNGKVVVEYRVNPGPDHQVELVEISGNYYFDTATLRERMLVAEKGLISERPFQQRFAAKRHGRDPEPVCGQRVPQCAGHLRGAGRLSGQAGAHRCPPSRG